MKAIYFIANSGVITKCIDASEEIILINKSDEESIFYGEVDNIKEYLIVNNELQKKQEMQLNVNGNVIRSIPKNTYVQIGFQDPILVDDGEVEIYADYSQKLDVYFFNEMYLNKKIEIYYEA